MDRPALRSLHPVTPPTGAIASRPGASLARMEGALSRSRGDGPTGSHHRGVSPPVPSREQRLWRILWSGCPGVGVVRLAQLERFGGGLPQAWAAPADALARRTGWPASLLATIESYRQRWGEHPLPRLAQACHGGRGLLLPCDPRWPPALQTVPRPPLWLHWRGRGSLWPLLERRQAIAIVGTRQPSEHGVLMARRLGAHLAAHGWPVVSGLAEGIDAAAHRGCLARGGAPVGVLGTPLQRVYPRHHHQLQAEVGRRGLLMSEWPAETPTRPGHFASRNRLLVALAAAVVVVECPPDSGALHSAELAWQQGLPLWAVPGDAARLSALGSNRLLTKGATPLLDPADLTDQIGPGPLADRALVTRSTAASALLTAASPLLSDPDAPAARVLAALGEGADLEELGGTLSMPAPLLSRCLLQLELAGLVQPEPGLRWRPT